MKNYQKSGVTLVELLVALLILSIILIMGAAATNLTVGKMRSKKTTDIVQPVRNAFDIISQKMNTANDKKLSIYGFALTKNGVIDNTTGNTLAIVNTSNSNTQCVFIGLVGTVLRMTQNACAFIPTLIVSDHAITPDNIKVNSFSFPEKSIWSSGAPSQIPYITIEIIAQDPNDDTNKIDLRTSYFLDYQTVNNLK